MTKSSRGCLHSFFRNIMEIIVSVSYPFTNPIGVALRLLEKEFWCWICIEIVICMGSAYYAITSLFPFLSGVQVVTIKSHYFRNLYFPLKLFKVRDRRFDSLWAHWDFSLTWSFRPHYSPGVHSASNRNEYHGYLLGGKDNRCVGLITLPHSCVDCWASASWSPKRL